MTNLWCFVVCRQSARQLWQKHTTAIRTSPAPLTRKMSDASSRTAEKLSRGNTCVRWDCFRLRRTGSNLCMFFFFETIFLLWIWDYFWCFDYGFFNYLLPVFLARNGWRWRHCLNTVCCFRRSLKFWLCFVLLCSRKSAVYRTDWAAKGINVS